MEDFALFFSLLSQMMEVCSQGYISKRGVISKPMGQKEESSKPAESWV